MSSLLGSQNGKAFWTILHFQFKLILFDLPLGRKQINIGYCSQCNLHRIWMVSPRVVKQGGPLWIFQEVWWFFQHGNIWYHRSCQEGVNHLPSDDSSVFLIASIQNAVCEVNWWSQSSFCDQRYRTYHLQPKDGRFRPVTRSQKLSSLILLCVFSSLTPLVSSWPYFFLWM